MANSLLTKILNKRDFQYAAREQYRSITWLEKRMHDAISYGVIEPKYMPKNIYLGRMYLYVYWPKHADTLPYYDVNPLVTPIAKYDDGFLGLNWHYLHPMMRERFFKKLAKYTTGKGMNHRYQITYDVLKEASDKMPEFKPMIKRYLYDHIETRILQIPMEEWPMAIHLPMAKFVGVSTMQTVFTETNKVIRRR